MSAKTSTPRVNKLRGEAKRKGWKRRDYYATPDEHKRLRILLSLMRTGPLRYHMLAESLDLK